MTTRTRRRKENRLPRSRQSAADAVIALVRGYVVRLALDPAVDVRALQQSLIASICDPRW